MRGRRSARRRPARRRLGSTPREEHDERQPE
jgi:hypothetical protein